MRGLALLALAVPAAASLAEGAEGTRAPIFTVQPPNGTFLDDGFALRADGRALAYATTDGAHAAQLHLVELGPGRAAWTMAAPPTVKSVHWLGADAVLVIGREDAGGDDVTARLLTPSGQRGRLPAADAIAVGIANGKAAVFSYARRRVPKAAEHRVAAFDTAALRPIGHRFLREDASGRLSLGGAVFKPLWWQDSYATLVALKSGEYDKVRDIRQPDRLAIVDILSGTVTREKEIADLVGFAHVTAAHHEAARETQALLVHVHEEQGVLGVIDGDVERELKLPRPFWKYDPATLRYQVLDATRLLVSLTVDPVNREAVARKKAEPNDIDVFEVDRNSLAAAHLLRLSGEGRPNAWQAAGGRIAVLRRSKGFDRGGVALEVHELTLAPTPR